MHNGTLSGAPAPMDRRAQEEFQLDLQEVERGLRLTSAVPVSGEESETTTIVEVQLTAARKLRELLSSNRELLIQEVLDRNWIPLLLGWLSLHHCPSVQVEALWALTNVAAGTTEHTHVLIKHGAVPTLVSLLDSSNEEVLEQALWVLGNLAGEGVQARDAVLGAGVLTPLVRCLESRPGMLRHGVLSLLRIGSWALSNLCDGQPRPQLELPPVMRALQQLLRSADPEVLSHTCWALSHLCDGPSSHIKTVVEGGVCPRLVDLLSHRSWRVTKPALRTIGNIVCAEDDIDYTQHIIEAGAVRCLRILISHSNREIQKEACWTLSNIAAGTVEQIQTVLDSGVIPPLISIATVTRTDGEVRSEACWVVLNATSCGSDAQIKYLVSEGCTKVLMDLLSETSMVMMALEGLERILQVGEDEARNTGGANPYAPLLSAQRIEELEHHKSQAIAKRAARIWRTHYVTCAICNLRFPKASDATRFCPECKCFVCSNCNCSIYHLTFQEEYWAQMEGKEAKEASERASSKRNRKQRKKQKLKERKQAKAKAGGVDDVEEKTGDHDEMLARADAPLPPAAAAAGGGAAAAAELRAPQDSGTTKARPKAGKASENEKPNINGKSNGKWHGNGAHAAENGEDGEETMTNGRRGRRNRRNKSENSSETAEADRELEKAASERDSPDSKAAPADLEKLRISKTAAMSARSEMPTVEVCDDQNDDLVDILLGGGSILDVAKMLEEEDV
eukprot:scaffold4604_cov257-Pinguiococcus_pyrenoidosus.AAC.5